MSDKKRKPKAQDLAKLAKYPNWYMQPTTKQLVWRKHVDGKPETIRTGIIGKLNEKTGSCEGIQKAQKVVDLELKKRQTGDPEEKILREQQGVTNPLLEDIWKEMRDMKVVGKEPGTIKNYDKAWKHGMRGFWGTEPKDQKELEKDRKKFPHTLPEKPFKTVADMTTANVAKYKAWYLKKNSERLFEKTFDFFKMFSTYLFDRKYIKEMPDLSELADLDEIIKKITRYQKAGRVYTPVEEKALLGAWEQFLGGKLGGTTTRHKQVLAARARCGTTLGLRCGIRESELLKTEKSQIDFQRKKLRIWSFKNHEWREIPMTQEVREALRYQIDANAHLESKWLFPMPSNPKRHLSSQVWDKTWERVRKYSGIKVSGPLDARFHDCRKTFATRTAEWGWPPKVACAILDMTLDMYEKVYVTEVSLDVKAKLMNRDFGGAK